MKNTLKGFAPHLHGFIWIIYSLIPLHVDGGNPMTSAHSLPRSYEELSYPSVKIKLLLNYIVDLKEQNPSKALYYVLVADSLAITKGLRFYGVQTAFWLAWLNHYEGAIISNQSALIDAKICLNRLCSKDPPYWRAKVNALMAAIYAEQENYAFAQKYLNLALSLAHKIRPKSDSLNLRGDLHSILAIMPSQAAFKTEQHFQQAIINYSATSDHLATARVYRNYALYLLKVGQSFRGDKLFQKSLQLYRQENALDGLRKTLVYYANYWTELFNQSGDALHFQQAQNLLNEALVLNPDFQTYFQIGYIYQCFILKHSSSKYYPAYLDSTHHYYELALKKITSSNDFDHLNSLALNIEKLSLISPFRYGTISELAPAYERLLKAEIRATQRANERLRANERAKYYSELLNYFLMGLIILAIFLVLGLRLILNNKKAHRETYVQLLQTRLNPHFISNSLNSINALVHLKKDRIASEYLVKFNRFCRNVLEASDKTYVSLKEELETLTLYLDLEKLRLGEHLNYKFQIDENINLSTTQIPLFLLQPFLENAIWHGIHPKAEGGIIILSLQKMSDQRICIEIEDNGVGRSVTLPTGVTGDYRRSWGKNISDERLKIFNKNRGIPVDIKDGTNGIGTRVTIFLYERLSNK